MRLIAFICSRSSTNWRNSTSSVIGSGIDIHTHIDVYRHIEKYTYIHINKYTYIHIEKYTYIHINKYMSTLHILKYVYSLYPVI